MNAVSVLPSLPVHGHSTLNAYRPFSSTWTCGFTTSNFFFVVMHVIVTVLSSVDVMSVNKHNLEYHLQTWAPLQPNYDLHSDTEALYVDGIGWIAQYHNWVDKMYTHGFIYYLRDKTSVDLMHAQTTELKTRLASLNSKIEAYEAAKHGDSGSHRCLG